MTCCFCTLSPCAVSEKNVTHLSPLFMDGQVDIFSVFDEYMYLGPNDDALTCCTVMFHGSGHYDVACVLAIHK